jgi:acetylornithine deacetylase/succinyl-diaminopimelate desuccinylase-like protein
VPAPALISPDQLIDVLRALCAQPSASGQSHELAAAADTVRLLMARCGLDATVVPTPGAPVVIGMRAAPSTGGARAAPALLLYHHYDTAPTGPWRLWHHEPHALAERDGALYARGAAAGKGPLAAHLGAIAAMLDAEGELPCGVVVVAEGEALTGSAGLPHALAGLPYVDAVLASVGERDAVGNPFCYTGSKGLLRAHLRCAGASESLPTGMAAVVANPLWRIVWALACIKGEDEDIRIDGFYDSVEGPSRDVSRALRATPLDEAGRLAAWGLTQFLFGMSGAPLISAEVTLPTCNLASLSVEPASDPGGIPTCASAQLDFQLVPTQRPVELAALMAEHLNSHGFGDVACSFPPGGYEAAAGPADSPLVRELARVGAGVFGVPLNALPLGPFAAPLSLLRSTPHTPVASIGCARPTSAVRHANEHILVDDLLRHGQLLVGLLHALGEAYAA